MPQNILTDQDPYWHIAAGRWMLQHHQIPTTDPFSFTAAGHPWVAMEWLADLVYAGAFNLAGYAGLAAVVGAALVALHAIVLLHIRRSLGPIGVAAAIVGMDVVLGAFILARPHVLVWPIVAGWTALLLRSRIGNGLALPTASLSAGTEAGGGGGGTPRMLSRIHLPRMTGDVRVA